MPKSETEIAGRIKDFILTEAAAARVEPVAASDNPFWAGLKALGTELWLDTGDIEAASRIWNSSFSALTTNNTLLNAEIQKGIYDRLIIEAAKACDRIGGKRKIIEIAFVLNAVHGLRLAKTFGAKVSVELHTDFAHDIDATVEYARRFREISPASFIVKIPFTPAGLIATRKVREEGIPVNFTLGFSARQNYLAAAFARPDYVNVFLGRINSYIADNGLGDGKMAGEKATLASQKCVSAVSAKNPQPVRMIAASMREPSQIDACAGVDVFTMPVKVAEAAFTGHGKKWKSRREYIYEVRFKSGELTGDIRCAKLWDISDRERALVKSLDFDIPQSAIELVERCQSLEIDDLFPLFNANETWQLSKEGKIPRHDTWKDRIERGALALDSLLNLAALESFAADQKALDDRIFRVAG